MGSSDSAQGKVRQRHTRQRAAVLNVCESVARPLTVEEIHERAGHEVHGIGLRTIYRNVSELVAEGFLINIDYPGQPTRYERVSGQHRPHLVCQDCGKLFVLEADTPEIEVPCGVPSQFRITGSEVIFYGRCTRENCPERLGS